MNDIPDRAVPLPAKVLGAAGLLPPLGAIAAVLLRVPQANLMLLGAMAYAALILSFLGGMWWGVASAKLPREALRPWLTTAVMPSLIGWTALAACPFTPRAGTALLAIALVATLLGDRRLQAAELVPAWWMRLRVPLSCGLALATIAVGQLTAIA